jgi:hypothetical protein
MVISMPPDGLEPRQAATAGLILATLARTNPSPHQPSRISHENVTFSKRFPANQYITYYKWALLFVFPVVCCVEAASGDFEPIK